MTQATRRTPCELRTIQARRRATDDGFPVTWRDVAGFLTISLWWILFLGTVLAWAYGADRLVDALRGGA